MSVEKTINWLASCTAAVLAFGFCYFGANSLTENRSRNSGISTVFRDGTTAKRINRIPSFDSSKNTLLIGLSTACKYCDASVPFYEELARKNSENQKVNLVAVFREDKLFVEDFLSRSHLHIESLSETDFGEMGIRGTPTIVLINEDKNVIQMWEGQLTPSQEAEIRKGF